MSDAFYTSASRTEGTDAFGATRTPGPGGANYVEMRRVSVPVTEPYGPVGNRIGQDGSGRSFGERLTRPALWALILPGDRGWIGDIPVLIWSVHLGDVRFMLWPDSDFGGDIYSLDGSWYGNQDNDLTLDLDRCTPEHLPPGHPRLVRKELTP